MRIPNLVARGLYVERLRERWLPATDVRTLGAAAAERLYLRADPTPLCELIEQHYFAVLSNRDDRSLADWRRTVRARRTLEKMP